MTPSIPLWVWTAFTLCVLAILALDLGVFNRKSHIVTVRQALAWTGVWIALSASFCVGLWLWYPARHGAVEYLTGYLVEYALSVDNIFVFLLIFAYFRVAPEVQHKVLFWGILGAIVMRALMITGGAALLAQFEWVIYVFAAFLLFAGYKLAFGKETHIDPGRNPLVLFVKRFIPVTDDFRGDKFFVVEAGRRLATPLFLVLLVVETTDLVFAVDSIPAIFGVTKDPFIVFSSNIFAILGLRSLYFALAGVMERFYLLKYALAFILGFIGLKMLLAHTALKIATPWALGVVSLSLALAVVLSLLRPQRPQG